MAAGHADSEEIQGISAAVDGLSINPATLSITVRSGETGSIPISLDNSSGSRIDWKLSAVDDLGRTSGLEGQLAAVINSGNTLNGPLPARHDFTGGAKGGTSVTCNNSNGQTAISQGNRLLTNLGGPLAYTDDYVAASTVLGPQGRYFTRKLPGLFVFGAETDGIQWFEVAGGISYGNSKKSTAFRLYHRERWWSGFVVNHVDYWSTINHLILVDQEGLQQTLGSSSSEQQRITGLSGKRRIYHFLYLTTSTTAQPQSAFEDLAKRFLNLLPEFGSRLSFAPATGSSPASGGEGSTALFDAAGLATGTYHGTAHAQSPAGSGLASAAVAINVTEPLISVPGSVEREMFAGQVAETFDLPLASNLDAAQPWTAEPESPAGWLTVGTPSGTTPQPLRVRIDPDGRAPGVYAAVLIVRAGPAVHRIPVSLRIRELAISKFVADPFQPRVYAIHKNGLDQGALLVFDSITRRILHAVPTGKEPTDCDVAADGSKVWVINSKDPSLMAVSTSNGQLLETIPLTGFSSRNRLSTEPGAHVKCGKGSIVYYVDEQWGPRLRVFDTATRTLLQTFSAESGVSPDTSNNLGYGDIALNPQRTRLFGWRQYGDGAGVGGSHIVRFDIGADGRLENFAKSASYSSANFDREPYDTPVLVTADGSRVAIKDREVDPLKLDTFPLVYPAPLYSLAGNGRIAVSASKIYSAIDAREIAALPVSSPVQTILPDLTALVYFNTATKTPGWVDLVATLGGETLGLPVFPADRAVVTSPQRLEWPALTGINRYRVYLGSSEAEVNAATPGSASDLGETTHTWLDLAAAPGIGRYYWRVVPLGEDGQPISNGMTLSFTVANMAFSRSSIQTATIAGNPNQRETIQLTAPLARTWSATANVPWIGFESAIGNTPGELAAVLDASSLTAGVHNGEIQVTCDGVTTTVPVTLTLHAPNYTLARADLEKPRIYAVSEGTQANQPAFLMVFDTATNKIVRTVPIGTSVTSMSVHYADNRIYLTNWKDGLLRAIDRDSLEEVRGYAFDPPSSGYGTGSGDCYVVAAGRAGRVILEQQDQWINVFLVDTGTGRKTATATDTIRQGGGIFEPSGRFYYHGESNSSGAALKKYDTQGDAFTLLGSKRVESFNYYGARWVGGSGDGSRVFWNGGVFDADLNVLIQLNEEIITSTYRGELLFTNTKAVNGISSQNLATLPVDTKVQAVSGDQKKLFLFKNAAVSVVDIATIANVPPRGMIPGIADKSVVIGTSQELAWSQEAVALSYDVYFGSSAAAVAAATKDSPEFLGNVSGTRWTGSLADLALGGEYFWRVDLNGFSSITKGAVWSFQVAPVDVTPRRLEIAVPAGSPVPRQSLAMSAPAPLAWTATSSTPWITAVTPSGTAPDTLRFDISTAGLTVGTKSGSITVQSAGRTFSIPVELSIVTLNVTKLVPHPRRPLVYAINTALTGEGFSHLLELDAVTAAIRRTLPIGFAPTDADLDPDSGRLYVSNWGYDQTRVIDVDAWRELSPLNLGTDIYRLEITPDGRLITEGEDQWVQLDMWDAASGGNLASSTSPYFSVREGDGQADPTGNHYYRCDNNSSGAVVTKYDIRTDSFVTAVTGPQIGYGSRNLILSEDGSRLFWLGRVMDKDLALLGQMPGEIHATNRSGDLAVGPAAVWWSDSGTQVATLPFSSTVAAFTQGDTHLLRYNSTARTLHSTPVSSLTDLPGPWPRPGQVLKESPARLTWTPTSGAASYRVFIAADAASLQSMTSPTATVGTAEYLLAAPLDFGRFYSWRVDAVTGSGTVTGKVNSFGVEFPAGPALPKLGTGSPGIAASLADRHLLVGIQGSAQLYHFDPGDGRASPIQSFTLPGYYGDHNFGAAVAMDAGKAAVGAYTKSATYDFRSGPAGYWESSGPLNPPAPVAGEGFGRGLASSGNLMLSGTHGNYGIVGRVCAYVTEPAAILTQTFSASDAAANDGFGRVIAMDGNLVVISAPGSGQTYNRIPCLYAFSRSTNTGLWAQTQKIAIPGASTSNSSGQALALSGNTLATSSNSAVILYTRNTSGQWVHSVTINRSTIPNSSSSFGVGLALVGDQLFVGDPYASHNGSSGGAVFSFRRSGSSWVAGPVIAPSGSRENFGTALAVRDHWLVVAGGSSQPAWLFRIGSAENRTPRFVSGIPTQVVAGRDFSIPALAEDPDGNSGLVIEKLQGPPWLAVTDQGNGQATLNGTPAGASGTTHTVQLRVRDAAGSQALHTYQLTLLAPTDLPVLVASPLAADLGVGQELVLRASVGGIGPFQWQWFRDGQAIEGANGSTYVVGEVGFENAGRYHVSVSNVVGAVESAAVEVNVRPADRFAGDWPTFGGSPAHTGRHPAALDSCWFVPAWTQTLQQAQALNRAAIAGGRAVVVPRGYFVNGLAAKAVDLETGAPLWSFPFPSSYSSNPPSIHDGKVYFQRGKGTGDVPQLFCLDAATGKQNWASTFEAQWESYEAPAVSEQGIFINGGSYGGIYGFNDDGTRRFFQSLSQYDDWSPTLANGRLFSWVAGSFTEHNPSDGAALWTVNSDWDWSGWSMNGVSAISGNSAALISTTGLLCVDLPSRSIRWYVPESYGGSPGIGGGRVFAIRGNAVRSYALADGAPGLIYQTGIPSASLIEQPILFNDRLAISSEDKTWIFDLQSARLLQTLNGGGRLSYSNGYLLAAGSDGVLRAFRASPHGRLAVSGPDESPLENNGAALRVGSPPVGGSTVTTLKLSNSGIAGLGSLSWLIEGAHAADFAVTRSPATSLAPAAETTMEITHTPSDKGRREAILVLSNDDPSQPQFRIPLYALPPDVGALAASDITGVSATLHGHVAANDNELSLIFEYGLTNAYGTMVTADPAALAGDDDLPVSAAISGLPPGTLHHYRVGATNAHGTHWSEGRTFTTLSDNAKLGALNVFANLSTAFDPEVFSYIGTVPYSVTSILLRPVKQHPGARIEINGRFYPTIFSPPQPLAVGHNTITILVTAEDRITTLTYTIIITRLPEFLSFGSSGAPGLRADGFSAIGVEAPLRLDFHPPVGTSLTVVENNGLKPISGEFSNLKQGQRITLQYGGVDYHFYVNYFGGTGNDLVLHWADTFAAAWGQNNQGQLGDGSTTNRTSPVLVEMPLEVLAGKTMFAVSAGYLHSLALCHDGTLASWGHNTQGQLGLGHQNPAHMPGKVTAGGALAGKTVIAIATGAYHNLALCSDGTIVAWGYNNHGQLGTGDRLTRSAPVVVGPAGALTGKRVTAIAAGSYHSLALCDDGTVAAWGYNDEGELGDGATQTALTPVQVAVSGVLAGKAVARIAAGQYHSLALCTDGTLVSWGYNGRGQLGDGTTIDRHLPVAVALPGDLSGKTIAAPAAGGSHSLLRFDDGALAGWGDNARGQLVPGGEARLETPQLLSQSARVLHAGAQHTVAMVDGESLHAWGDARAALASTAPETLYASARWIAAASGPAAFHNLAIAALPSQVGVPANTGDAAALSGYAAWKALNAPDEGGGVAPLVCYAFGLDAQAPDASKLPRPALEQGALTLRFRAPDGVTGVRYGAEWSMDLKPGGWQELPDTGSGGEHRFVLPETPAGRGFMRLKVLEDAATR